MAPLPKKRLSRQRGRERLAGQVIQIKRKAAVTTCSNCKKVTKAHTACRFCGYYKGKKIIAVSG